MNRARIAAVFGLALTLGATTASAQEFTKSARSAGMGEAFVAAATGTLAIPHNPAGLAQTPTYQIDALFEYAGSPVG